MNYKKGCQRVVKKFLKNAFDNLYCAFSIGFDDGVKGEMQEFPELHDPSTGTLYAQELFAMEMYKRGFKAGKEGVEI